jgi:hypothetical protein
MPAAERADTLNIHDTISGRTELAAAFAADGAFYTASRILDELAEAVWSHADATSLVGPQTTADRSLRLAAPDILSALKGLICFRNWEIAEGGVVPSDLRDVWKNAEAAIAKAEGRS